MQVFQLKSWIKIELLFKHSTPEHAAQPLIQLVVGDLIGTTDMACPATPDNAVRTSEVLDAILSSYYGGRHDEFWLRDRTWPGLK